MSLAGLLRFKGAAVTFTLVTMTYDATVDTSVPTTSTVAGYAAEINGDVEEYKALELIASQTKTLQFSPTTSGETPPIGSTVSWNSETYTVKTVQSAGLSGSPTSFRVVITK